MDSNLKRQLLKIAGWRRTDRNNQELWQSPHPDSFGFSSIPITLNSAFKKMKKSMVPGDVVVMDWETTPDGLKCKSIYGEVYEITGSKDGWVAKIGKTGLAAGPLDFCIDTCKSYEQSMMISRANWYLDKLIDSLGFQDYETAINYYSGEWKIDGAAAEDLAEDVIVCLKWIKNARK